jgi:signal transduction histidine kinase
MLVGLSGGSVRLTSAPDGGALLDVTLPIDA